MFTLDQVQAEARTVNHPQIIVMLVCFLIFVFYHMNVHSTVVTVRATCRNIKALFFLYTDCVSMLFCDFHNKQLLYSPNICNRYIFVMQDKCLLQGVQAEQKQYCIKLCNILFICLKLRSLT